MSRGRKKPSLHDLTLKLPEDADAILAELLGGSDRACALVAAAFLDRALVALLSTHMLGVPQEEQDPIFYGLTAFLGSFSSKITLCYATSLISKEDARYLHTMRSIRNHFAHSMIVTTFEDPEIAAECSTLWSDEDKIPPLIAKLPSYRAKFLGDCPLDARPDVFPTK
jgi:hypothetical protein